MVMVALQAIKKLIKICLHKYYFKSQKLTQMMNQNEGLVSFFIWPLTYILQKYFPTTNWKHLNKQNI
jgi:hypothetical protein